MGWLASGCGGRHTTDASRLAEQDGCFGQEYPACLRMAPARGKRAREVVFGKLQSFWLDTHAGLASVAGQAGSAESRRRGEAVFTTHGYSCQVGVCGKELGWEGA